MQTFEKGGANLRVLQRWGVLILRSKLGDFEAKISGVNSGSGENLHDFEIICPASVCVCVGGGEANAAPHPPAYRPVFNVKSQRVIFPRYSALV